MKKPTSMTSKKRTQLGRLCGETTGLVRVLREVLLGVSWAAEQAVPDRQEG
jgi:hypothetical protein